MPDRCNISSVRNNLLKHFFFQFTAPRSQPSCPGPNNLPPLQFHQIHGDNIRISRDGTIAKRYESFCKGITFSARPVKINERVTVKFSEISNNWSGVIRFGFTYNDPSTLRNSLPKYACPDLTNKPGYWAKALNERFCERDNILFYYVNAAGDVHFGINGEEKGVFITGVETRNPLYALIDCYGNCTQVEFLDSRIYAYQQQAQQQPRRSMPESEIERVLPALQSLSVRPEDNNSAVPSIRYNTNNSGLIPVPFHRTKGRNIRLTGDRCIANRVDTEFCQGYVFTARPLRIGEKLIVHILRTEPMYVGALALGLTSCDPATLQPTDLPDDSDLLLDRPEYWVVSKDVASTPQRGDEITFLVTPNGEVQISKNGGQPSVVMHVDESLQLWAFLDVYGSTQSVRVLCQPSSQQQQPSSPSRRLQVNLPATESMNSLNAQVEQRKLQQLQQQQNLAQQQCRQQELTSCQQQMNQHQQSAQQQSAQQQSTNRIINLPSNDLIQLQSGGTVLVVNLPPTHNDSGLQQPPRISQVPITASASSATLASYSNKFVEVSFI